MGLESSTSQKFLNSAFYQGTADRNIPIGPWTILLEGRPLGVVDPCVLELVDLLVWQLVVEHVGLVVEHVGLVEVADNMLVEVGYIEVQIFVFGRLLEYLHTSSLLLHLLLEVSYWPT